MTWKSAFYVACISIGLASSTPTAAQSQDLQRAEARLRQSIADLRNGHPNLDQMEPMLRVAVEQQRARMEQSLAALGALRSVEYVGPQNGAHVFKVTFDQGVTVWMIGLSPNGKTALLYFQPAQ